MSAGGGGSTNRRETNKRACLCGWSFFFCERGSVSYFFLCGRLVADVLPFLSGASQVSPSYIYVYMYDVYRFSWYILHVASYSLILYLCSIRSSLDYY